MIPLRGLPRAFVDVEIKGVGAFVELPEEEFKKFRSVLRLGSGDEVALLPGDGRVLRARLDGRKAEILEEAWPDTEASIRLSLALGLPKPDALEDSVRMASEMGVSHFILFAGRRSVVKWEGAKFEKKLARLRSISREACEVAYRTTLPTFEVLNDLAEVLAKYPDAVVMSESDQATDVLGEISGELTVVVGPEGGWDPKEVKLILRPVTMGRRVMRVSTAVACACALVLSNR